MQANSKSKALSTKECWRNFVSAGPTASVLTYLARFTGADRSTVKRWVESTFKASGLNLLKTRYFLAMIGFSVLELQNLSSEVYKLGEVIAFGLLPLETVTARLGYNHDRTLLNVILRQQQPLSAKTNRIAQIIEQNKDGVASAKVDFVRALSKSIPGLLTAGDPAAATAGKPRPDQAAVLFGKQDAIDTMVFLAKAILPLAELLESDQFTDADRAELRSAAGANTIFQLSTTLNRLCSAQARKHFRRRETGQHTAAPGDANEHTSSS